MRHARSVATGEPPFKIYSSIKKKLVVPNTALIASKTAAIPLVDGVLNGTFRSHQLKL